MDANRSLPPKIRHLLQPRLSPRRPIASSKHAVAHDLRAPLRSVDGFCQILDEEYSEKLDETGRNYLSRVRRAAQHIGKLIDDLLHLARSLRATSRALRSI